MSVTSLCIKFIVSHLHKAIIDGACVKEMPWPVHIEKRIMLSSGIEPMPRPDGLETSETLNLRILDSLQFLPDLGHPQRLIQVISEPTPSMTKHNWAGLRVITTVASITYTALQNLNPEMEREK